MKKNNNNTLSLINEKKENYINKDISNKIENIIKNNESINNKKELNEQIRDMPFLILPIKFLKFNKKMKNSLCYYIIIILALLTFIFFSISKSAFLYIFSELNQNSDDKKYIKNYHWKKQSRIIY